MCPANCNWQPLIALVSLAILGYCFYLVVHDISLSSSYHITIPGARKKGGKEWGSSLYRHFLEDAQDTYTYIMSVRT